MAAANAMSSLCRLTVMTKQSRVDLAVPLELSVSEFLAMLVGTLGPKIADEGASAGGYVLQRAGEAPLDGALTLGASQVRDGDVLQLTSRSEQLPEIAYDDVLDAVADGVNKRSVRWAPTHTRHAALWGGALLTAFVLLACLLAGPTWIASAVVSGLLAVALIGSAVALRVGYQQDGAALTAGGMAVAAAAVSGACALGGHHALGDFDATQLLPAAAAAVLAAAICLGLVNRGIPGFVGIIGAGVLAAVGAAAAGFGDYDVSATAGLAACAALVLSPMIPMAAFKLSRLSLPIVPTDAADLRSEGNMINSAQVLRQAARADQLMTGLVVALALVLGGAAVLLGQGDLGDQVLACALSALALLRARLFGGRAQRSAMLSAGVAGACSVLLGLALDAQGSPWHLVAVVVPAVLLALLLFAFAVLLPGRRYSPASSRMADVVEALLALSVLPLILWVIGVYSQLRSVVG